MHRESGSPAQLDGCGRDGTMMRRHDIAGCGSALPTLIVIGTMKCATTALHDYLDAHPDITMSSPKELNFFSETPTRELGWYASHFDPRSKLRGESSPGYTSPSFPDAAARMASATADVRLLYLVRDPVERALSQYRHHLRDQTETRPLDEAVLDPNSQYIARSRYYERLEPFLQHFDPSQIHVVVQERLLADRDHVMAGVYRHVGARAIGRLPLPKAPDRRSSRTCVPPAIRSALWGQVRADFEQLRLFTRDHLAEWDPSVDEQAALV
jgi:Sulfotransferase family